ncbi:MAG: PAS domain S-box protein [Syntrophobacteraceae bacterium]
MRSKRALTSGEPYQLELKLLRPDGTTRLVNAFGGRKCDGAQQVTGLHGTVQDVTELKQAEESLRESERKFHSIFDSMSEIVVLHELICDTAGRPVDYRILDCNPAFTRSTGISAERAVGALASKLYDTGEPPYLDLYAQVALTGKPMHFEAYFAPMRKHFAISAVSPAQGRFATVSTDITECKQAEEKIQFRNVLLSTQQEASIDGILVVDEKACVISYNRRFVEMWGLPAKLAEARVDGPVLQFVTAQVADPSSFLQRVQYLYEHRQDTSRDEIILADGRVFDRYSAPMFGAGELYYGRIWYFRDITEIKQVEKALRVSEAGLDLALRSAYMGVWSWDIQEDKRYFDHQVCHLHGINPATFTGKAEEFFGVVHPDDHEIIRTALHQAVTEDVLYETAYRAVWPDGSAHYIRARGRLNRDEAGLSKEISGIIWDITERKRSEEQLRESEEAYRTLVNLSPDAISTADLNGLLGFASPKARQMFGHAPDDEILGRSLLCWVAPEEQEKASTNIQHLLTKGFLKPTEYTLIKEDGTHFIGEVNAAVMYSPDGSPMRMIFIIRDVTERKQAEDALISKNRELNDIIEFLPDATFVIDKDRKIIAWNRAIEEMTGIDKKDMIGKPDSLCTVPFYGESRPYLLDLISFGDKDLESEYGYVERKGDILCAETYVPCVYGGRGAFVFATGAPLYDIHGKRVGAIESIRDITESKKKEDALLESQRRLADIINLLPDATLVIDKAGKVIAWNRAIEEMTGIHAADMLGKDNFEYALPFYGERRPILIDLVLRPQEEVEADYTYVERNATVIAGEAYMPALRGGEVQQFPEPPGYARLKGVMEELRQVSSVQMKLRNRF